MLRFFGIGNRKLTKKVYDKEIGKTVVKAHRIGYFSFAFQWGIWEYLQKKGEIDQSFLWG